MGLDNYWVYPGTEKIMSLEDAGDLKLCGGLLSGNGNGSFRGKVYNAEVVAATGVSLYQRRIDNATVREMAKALGVSDDLGKMFALYADAGADLVSWY